MEAQFLHLGRAISVANLAVFPRIWAYFGVDLRFFKACGLLVFGLFYLNVAYFGRFLFCGLLSYKFLGRQFCCFNLQHNLGVFLCKFAHFGLVFTDLPPASVLNLPAIFCCVQFSYQTHCGLVCANNLASLGAIRPSGHSPS